MKKTNSTTGLYLLSIGEAIDRFSYFGILTIIVLYMLKHFDFNNSHAFVIYSTYAALAFALPILGGILADRLLGSYNAIFLGGLLIVIGNLVMVFSHLTNFYIGLSIFLIGSGLFKPSTTSEVGNLYDNPVEKTKAYTFFYVLLNIGAIVGPITFGILGSTVGWSWGFILSAMAMAACLIGFYSYRSIIKSFTSIRFIKKQLALGLIITGLGIIATIVSFHYYHLLQAVLIASVLMFLLYLFINKGKADLTNKKFYAYVALLLLASIIFFSISLQIGSSLTIFIQDYVNRNIFNIQIPTPIFSSLDPLFVVLMAPVVTKLWLVLKNKNIIIRTNQKLAFSIYLAAIAMLLFAAAAATTELSTNLTFILIILGNLFLGAGEITISPTILSAISERVPNKLKSTMMGLWYFSIAIAGYLSGSLASFQQYIPFQIYFLCMTVYALIFGFIVLIVVPAKN